MKKTRYTEEQIAFALKQAETGTAVSEVVRRMGISEQTFYRWEKVYGGLGVGELRRLCDRSLCRSLIESFGFNAFSIAEAPFSDKRGH